MSDTDALLPLQKAIVDVLKASTVLGPLIADRVFDRVAPTAQKPYVSFGPRQAFAEIADEYEGSDSRIQIDVWSNAVGAVEAIRIGRAIRTELQGAELSLTENQRLVTIDLERSEYLTEPDGLTTHGVLIFRARTEPTV